MKKLISALLVSVMFIMNVYAEDIKLEFEIGASTAKLNGTTIQAQTYLSELGNTMVGLRAVVETLGVNVEWIEETRTVKLSDEGLDMEVVIDSDIAFMNGQPVKMTEAATIRNDRTMVPIRFISEGFGAVVIYHEDTHSVTIQANSRDERYRKLADSLDEMISNYPTALQGWLMSTDDTPELSDFNIVWDSVVNTRIMEILPGRLVTKEISDSYRSAAKLEFDNVFRVTGSTGNDINTPIMFEINGEYETGYASFVYNPVNRTILTDTSLSVLMPTQKPMFESNVLSGGGSNGGGSSGGGSGNVGAGGGGSSGGGSDPGVKPNPTVKPSVAPTAVPTVIPTAEPTTMPTAVPTIKPTIKPTMTPTTVPTVVPTVKPTLKPTAEPHATPSATYEPSATESPSTTEKPSATRKPSSQGGGSAPSVPSATDEPDFPEATEMPTMNPTMMPTMMPTFEPEGEPPVGEPTSEPEETASPEPTFEPTPEPTPQITDGPEGDDDHFDDIINGEDDAENIEFGIRPDILWVRYNNYLPLRSRFIIKFLR